MLESLATGQPWVTKGTGFDFAPLVLALVMLGSVRLARFRIRTWMIPTSMFLGVILDDLADAADASMVSTIALVLVLMCAVSLRRMRPGNELPPTGLTDKP